ncbi:MAG: hypothetical protein R3C59_14560 [Planctomycetaceae bacterium]
MADEISNEAVDLALRWRDENATYYGNCFIDVHTLSGRILHWRNEIGAVVSNKSVEASHAYMMSIGFEDPEYWRNLTPSATEQVITLARRAGLNPAEISFPEIPADQATVGLSNFWCRRSNQYHQEALIARVQNAKIQGFPVEISGAFECWRKDITQLSIAIETTADALTCVQADGGFPFPPQIGSRLANSLMALLFPYAEFEHHVVPYFRAYYDWTLAVQRLYTWLVYKDRTLKPRPILATPDQIVVDELARARGSMKTPALKDIAPNCYRKTAGKSQLDRLEDQKVIERVPRQGVKLTPLGWRCTSIERPGD